MTNSWVTLVEIDWDGGTEYYSGDGVNTATQHYSPRLLNVSQITREVSLPSRGMSTATCEVVLANEDNYFSAKRADENWRNRIVRVKFGDLLDPTNIITVFTGQIRAWQMSDHRLSLTVWDNYGDFFRNTIEGRFTEDIFPDIPQDIEPSVIPIVYYFLYRGVNGGGMIPCTLVDPSVTNANYVYVICRHTCDDTSSIEVYVDDVKKATPADYTITENVYGGYTCTCVEFSSDQRPGVVTCQYLVGWDGTTSLSSVTAQIESFLEDIVGLLAGDIDAASFTAALTDYTLGTNGHICAGWIGRDVTIEECLDRWMASTNGSIYRTRAGKIGLFLFCLPREYAETGGTALAESDIIGLTVTPNDRVVSRLGCNYAYNWAKDFFALRPSSTGFIEELELGQVIRDSFDAYMKHSGAETIRREARYLMREDLHYASFELPPQFWELDLWDLVRITHRDGVGTGGWQDQQARIVAITLDPALANPRLSVRAVVFPQPRPTDMQDCAFYVTAQHMRSDSTNDPADGDAVATWEDLQNGWEWSQSNLTQGTAGNKPVYRSTGGPLGLACVDFDGSDDYLKTANPLPFDIYFDTIKYVTVVFRSDDIAAGTHVIAGQCASGAIVGGLVMVAGKLRATVDGGTHYAESDADLVAGTWYVVTMAYNWAWAPDLRLYINGVLQTDTDSSAVTASTGPFCVGAADDGTEALNGAMAECAVYWDQTFAGQWRKMIEKAWGELYGITITH